MFISYWGSTKCEKTVVEGLIIKRQIEMAVTITITHILPNLKKHAHKQDSVFVNVLGGIGNWGQGHLRRQSQKCWTSIDCHMAIKMRLTHQLPHLKKQVTCGQTEISVC